jgi:hypothetical protein
MMDMSGSTNQTFDPFSKLRQPKDRAETAATVAAEAAAVQVEKKPAPLLNKHTVNLTATELLHWIQHRWSKPFIFLRDLQIFGPIACKDHATALRLAMILEKNGWLKPVKTWRRDRRLWKTPRAIALGL